MRCMQIGPANGIVQPGSQVSSELWNTLRTRWTVAPRSSSVFSLLHRRSCSSAAEYCIGEHESEGCVSLSGGAEHRLKVASASAPPKVVNTNVPAGNLVSAQSVLQLAKSAQRRFVTFAPTLCAQARSPRATVPGLASSRIGGISLTGCIQIPKAG